MTKRYTRSGRIEEVLTWMSTNIDAMNRGEAGCLPWGEFYRQLRRKLDRFGRRERTEARREAIGQIQEIIALRGQVREVEGLREQVRGLKAKLEVMLDRVPFGSCPPGSGIAVDGSDCDDDCDACWLRWAGIKEKKKA